MSDVCCGPGASGRCAECDENLKAVSRLGVVVAGLFTWACFVLLSFLIRNPRVQVWGFSWAGLRSKNRTLALTPWAYKCRWAIVPFSGPGLKGLRPSLSIFNETTAIIPRQYSLTVRNEVSDISQVENESRQLLAALQSNVDRDIQNTGFTIAPPFLPSVRRFNAGGHCKHIRR